MRKKILILGLLSTAICAHAQDSLSIPPAGIPDKQLSDNNIRNVSLHTCQCTLFHSTSDTIECTLYPKNNYSGLNSLRERLAFTPSGGTTPNDETGWLGYTDTLTSLDDTLSAGPIKQLQSINSEYLNQLINRKAPVGAPILFFFQIGTTTLTDASQLANLDAIATVCNKFNLLPKVTGYADSATGNADGNSVLSKNRANYITAELIKRGMEEKSIIAKGEGGVATYSPVEVNRCVKVEIYLKQ